MLKKHEQETPAPTQKKGWGYPQETAPYLIFLVLVVSVVFIKVLINPGLMLWGNDIVRSWSESRAIQWHSFWGWKSFPLWDPTIYCGRSLTGDPLALLTYPPAWLFSLINTPSLAGFFLWLHVIACSWGMFLFARRKECDTTGALLAALTFSLSGKVAAHLFAGHVELLIAVLGLPWVLWAVEGVFQKPNWNSAAILGMVSAVTIFCGHVQMPYYHVLFIGCYAGIQFMTLSADKGWSAIKRPLTYLFLGSMFSLALSCPWWIPVIRQNIMLAARTQMADASFSTMGSMAWSDFLRFIWPFWGIESPKPFTGDAAFSFFWETTGYPGVIALLLAISAVVTIRGKGTTGLALLAMGVFFLALGENSPFYWLACKVIPGFSLFRCPGRLLFYVCFIVALLSGLMLTHGLKAVPRWILPTIACVAFEVILIGAAIIFRKSQAPIHGLWLPVVISAIFAVVSCLWVMNNFPDGAWRLTVLILVIGELFWCWQPFINMVDARQALPKVAVAEFLAEKHKSDSFRIYDGTGVIDQQTAARYGLEIATGYNPGVYTRYLDLYRALWGRDNSDFTEQVLHAPTKVSCKTILDLMNVQYVVAYEPDLGEGYERVYAEPETIPLPRHFVHQRKNALSRAFITAQAELPSNGRTVLDSLRNMDPRKVCIVEDNPIEGAASFQAIPIQRVSLSETKLSFNTAAQGVVILSQTWHPDWAATDNGQPVQVRCVNHNSLGIPVSAGEHTLRIWYRPWDFYIGCTISAVTWIGILLAALVAWLKRRSSSRTCAEIT